eukprot:5573732-Amphidinium_carterae.1
MFGGMAHMGAWVGADTQTDMLQDAQASNASRDYLVLIHNMRSNCDAATKRQACAIAAAPTSKCKCGVGQNPTAPELHK